MIKCCDRTFFGLIQSDFFAEMWSVINKAQETLMFKKIVEFFTGKKSETVTAPPVSAPYKVEPPAETTPIPYVPANEPPRCGCGRSSTGYCVGLHKLSPEAWASHPNNPDMVGKIVAEPAQPAKKPRKAVEKKPVVVKAPAAKAPAKSRAKKTPK
jgi:hypothetical protein